MGEPRIDAPRTVDQLAWWVQHGEELRLENERLRDRLIHERELTSMLAKLIRRAIDAPTRNECLGALCQAQEIHFVWSSPSMTSAIPESDADGKVTFRIGPNDGSKRPPELPPEERKKRADQRDRGMLNDGPGSPQWEAECKEFGCHEGAAE